MVLDLRRLSADDFPMKRVLLAISLTLTCTVTGVANVETATRYDETTSSFVTTGTVKFDVSRPLLSRVAGDFAGYGRWALKGVNGSAGNDKGFLTLLRSLTFHESSSPPYFQVLYDIDVVWPFGSTGNVIRFALIDVERDAIGPTRLVASLADSSIAVERFVLEMKLSGNESESRVDFRCETKLTPWLNVFFNLEAFRRNVSWRLVQVLHNFRGTVDAAPTEHGSP